jgi:hypothetical protein
VVLCRHRRDANPAPKPSSWRPRWRRRSKETPRLYSVEKKLVQCGNNGNYGKYGIHFPGTPVTMRDTEPDHARTAGRRSEHRGSRRGKEV